MELNSKIGHRNYAVVDVENLTAEELEAVKKAFNFEGISGAVPIELEIDADKDFNINYGRVHKAMGYTVVLDAKKQVRFIQKGSLTCDEISFMNKGNSCEFIRNWYLSIINNERWN